MAAHGSKRTRPAELVPGTRRVIAARMDYLPRHAGPGWRADEMARLADPPPRSCRSTPAAATITRCCAAACSNWRERVEAEVGAFGYRVFTDSAPVLEVALADKAGLGWRGKHTLLLNRDAGSMFFLGEIYTDLALPVDPPVSAALRQLHRLHRRLPDPGHPRAAAAGCAALHFLPDDRTQGQHSAGTAAADRQPRLRLR